MKMKLTAVVMGTALLALPGLGQAQFGDLGKAVGDLGKAVGIGGGKSSVSAAQIVVLYTGATRSVNSANVKMLRAVGLKDAADRAQLQAKNLTSGATKDSLEKAAKVQTENSKALEAKLQGGKFQMDARSKQQFSEGMADLGKGIIKYVALSKSVRNYTPSPADLTAAPVALYVVSSLPGSMLALGGSLKNAIAFARENNIPVPKESVQATSLL
jgi:hypothetical protein